MHIIIMAWLFVIATMAATLPRAAAGIALFVVAGVLPVAAWWVLALRRARARRARLAPDQASQASVASRRESRSRR
ncbi:MAG: hypothetical protein JSR18_16260 [Proteobacteria bacterium]|nr:hypothetical protein [Pseudomonadota bacterium]